MEKKTGTFFGIGVGPGDPDLITLKAIKVLQRVQTVFAAASTKNDHSLAVRIAKGHIPEETPVQKLCFPMTTDRQETQRAWKENANVIYKRLEEGIDVAFLTLGDPMTYSTFGYISKHIKLIDPDIDVKIVPGITSYQAAAARLNLQLVEGEESLMVISGANGGDRLRQLSVKPENLVFLKAYRNVHDITSAIRETDINYQCTAVRKCSQPDEQVFYDMNEFEAHPPEYWTLIIAKQKK